MGPFEPRLKNKHAGGVWLFVGFGLVFLKKQSLVAESTKMMMKYINYRNVFYVYPCIDLSMVLHQ